MANQNGQYPEDMMPKAQTPYPPVVEELLALPGSFAFPQAVDIARRLIRSQKLPLTADSFRYSVNPALSFPPADIDALEFEERDDGIQANLKLNLMGLHGAGSPLPAYFTEHVAQHEDEQDALRDFFDIFNHRLVTLLHGTWVKYRYYSQYEAQASDALSRRFFGFIGLGHNDIRQAKDLCWPRLMAYMGLIAMSGDAAGSLESILRHYFSHQAISIIPCIQRWVAVPEDQQTRLGEANCTLGEDFILGDELPDQTGKFRIRISHLTWERFNSFLPTEKNFAALQTLVKFVLRSRLEFDVELRLLPEEIRPWVLEEDSECRLGWTTWAGEGGDGVVILETDQQEL